MPSQHSHWPLLCHSSTAPCCPFLQLTPPEPSLADTTFSPIHTLHIPTVHTEIVGMALDFDDDGGRSLLDSRLAALDNLCTVQYMIREIFEEERGNCVTHDSFRWGWENGGNDCAVTASYSRSDVSLYFLFSLPLLSALLSATECS